MPTLASELYLENLSGHSNTDPGTGAVIYVFNGVPYVRTSTGIVGLPVAPTIAGAISTPTVFVQTYATADRTLSAYTPNAQSSAFTTTGATTDIASKADLNTLRVAYENLRAFTEDLAKLVNSVIDNEQSLGIAG